MKERSILYSAPMVRASIDDSKTQTRRIMREQVCAPSIVQVAKPGYCEIINEHGVQIPGFHCPYGQPGDRLWVREAWGIAGNLPHDPGYVEYRADCTGNFNDVGDLIPRWRPSIHMPRAASRITMEITAIRVERLQDISEEDAEAEGVFSDEQRPEEHDYKPNAWMCPTCLGTGLHAGLGANGGVIFDIDCRDCETHVQRFKNLWESINGPGSWGANPWVWVIEFKRINP